MSSDALQFTVSLGFSAPSWLVIALLMAFAGTGAAFAGRITSWAMRWHSGALPAERLNRELRLTFPRETAAKENPKPSDAPATQQNPELQQ